MTTTPDIARMMEAHIRMNMGVYFTAVRSCNDLEVVSSRVIPDIYWNFSYSPSLTPFTASKLSLASSQLRMLGRKPAIWQPSHIEVPANWSVQSKEAWLWLPAEEWTCSKGTSQNDELKILDTAKPTAAMRVVFESAYSSGGAPGDVGYFALPPEYGKTYESGQAEAPAVQRHFSGWVKDVCVVVGAVTVWQRLGGLYSVATHPAFRRRGFAHSLSGAATGWAVNQGAIGVMCQTEADSAVEVMYTKIGYKRTHVGCLLGQEGVA